MNGAVPCVSFEQTHSFCNVKTIIPVIRPFVLTLLILANLAASTVAQEVSIPDPGLNATIREALQKPIGPLTEQDLLSLTNLNARSRNVASIDGLEAARNLVALDLQINHLNNFSLPSELTNLVTLDVSSNPLTNIFLPTGLANLTSLTLESDGLTNLTLPADLTRLNNLDLENNQLTSFDLPSNLTNLICARPRLQFIHQLFPSGRADESGHVLFRRKSADQRRLASGIVRHDRVESVPESTHQLHPP